MSITDELREYVGNFYLFRYKDVRESLTAIADRIDAEHKKAVRELNDYASVSVLLPRDADGEPIHVGDVMKGEKIGGGFGEPFEVVGYIMSNGELEPMDEHKLPRKHKYLHHHHAPTVEDVLYDGLKHFGAVEERTPEVDSWVCEQAAKLREMLAGEDE